MKYSILESFRSLKEILAFCKANHIYRVQHQLIIFAECNTSLLVLPQNSGNQTFPSPFRPGTAVVYACASGFAVRNGETFMCNGTDGSFIPSTPPNCTQGIFSI